MSSCVEAQCAWKRRVGGGSVASDGKRVSVESGRLGGVTTEAGGMCRRWVSSHANVCSYH